MAIKIVGHVTDPGGLGQDMGPCAVLSHLFTFTAAEEIVPAMQRGQEVAGGSAGLPAPRYKVILWNGDCGRGGHFDATRAQDAP